MKIYELTEAGFEEAGETTDDKTDKKSTKKKPIKKTKEKLEAAKKVPADPNKATGEQDDTKRTLNIDDMSDEEIEALPPAALARLRGDTV